MYGLKQVGKHQFLQDLSRNVVRGQLEAAKNGSWIGSHPYAYRLEGPRKNKRLALADPGQVRIVQRIFREFVEEGRSMSNIASRLNGEGFVSPSGKMKGWRFDTVKVILENPAYTGDFAGGRWSYGKYHTISQGSIAKANGRCRRPEAEWIVHRDHHDPIIDRRTFEKARAILAKGKTGRSPYAPEENPCLLSCLLRCGRCGCTLKGMKGGKGGKYRYYECGNFARNGVEACEGTTVREDRILHAIADHLDQEFLSLDGEALAWKAERKELKPGDLPKAFAKVKKLISPPKQPALDRQRTEKQAKALSAQIDKAKRNLVLLDPTNIPTAEDEIRRLEAEHGQLELELRKRLPTETDVNAETMELLRSLYWLGTYFRHAATPMEEYVKRCDDGGWFLTCDNWSPLLKPYLLNVSAITVHTSKQPSDKGRCNGTRHAFQRGEIAFKPVGPVTGNLNPRLAG